MIFLKGKYAFAFTIKPGEPREKTLSRLFYYTSIALPPLEACDFGRN